LRRPGVGGRLAIDMIGTEREEAMKVVEPAVAKPFPDKLNPAWHAAVRRMLAATPQTRLPVKTHHRKRSSRRKPHGA
jgi:hypothetical protein